MADEHTHDGHCDCGCDCGCEDEMEVLVLVDDEDQEHEFELIGELEVDGANYKVLIPLDGEESNEEEEEVVILKCVLDENGEELLSDIEDDEEWEKVADAWDEALESGEFDD